MDFDKRTSFPLNDVPEKRVILQSVKYIVQDDIPCDGIIKNFAKFMMN